MHLLSCGQLALHPIWLLLLSVLQQSDNVGLRTSNPPIGLEVSVPVHLQDGHEFVVPVEELVAQGAALFEAVWTVQEGGGRPLTKGDGNRLTDRRFPLRFPRNFNRISAPDANSCAGCHNIPYGIAGGGGDIVANVFVLGQRFDFATFSPLEGDRLAQAVTKGSVDESGRLAPLQTIANSRNTLGMFGSGFIEMLARQMTEDLQALRDTCPPGGSVRLVSKGIEFGSLSRDAAGNWITSSVTGLTWPSLRTTGPEPWPNLIVRPFHQASNVISLRQFTNNAMNHHHGIQSTERFGLIDADDDGFVAELTRADVTAVSVFQATLAVPGRVIPNDPAVEAAVHLGEERFLDIGCTACHVPSLPLDDFGWIYTEPNPFNPPGNLQVGETQTLRVDLTSGSLPMPRLAPKDGVVMVPAFTDLRVHDITSGPHDPNREALDMNETPGSPRFFAGNGRFITRKLWGTANEPPYFHHGQYTTLREAIVAHAGEALASREAYEELPAYEQACVIEFLKTLRVLPPDTKHLVVDGDGKAKEWAPAF